MPPASIDAIPHPLDEYSNNAYFNPGDILPGISFWGGIDYLDDEIAVLGSGFMGNPSKTAVSNYFVEPYTIRFDPPVEAAGMDVQTFMGSYTCNMDIYGTGGFLGSTSTACNEAGVFWGVASDGDPIIEIVIMDLGGGAEGADNVAFGGGGAPDKMFATHVRIINLPGPGLLLGIVRMATGDGSIPVGGATVDVEWFIPPYPNYPIPQSRPTNANGLAFPIMVSNWDGTYVLDLVNATHPGYIYDASLNWQSSATITLP
jgi:hypothetical protein